MLSSDVKTSELHQPIIIKDFGNDRECKDLGELKEVLASKYCNRHIAIHWIGTSGLKQVRFISVLEDGSIVNSHTEKEIILDELL